MSDLRNLNFFVTISARFERCQLTFRRNGRIARSGAEGTRIHTGDTYQQRRKGSPKMKWHALNLYIKVSLLMGAIASLLLAAGAEAKWV